MKIYDINSLTFLSDEMLLNGSRIRYCKCPNECLHTTLTRATDCILWLDSGRLHCLHGHCQDLGKIKKEREINIYKINKIERDYKKYLKQCGYVAPEPKKVFKKKVNLRDIMPEDKFINKLQPCEFSQRVDMPWNEALSHALFPNGECHLVTAFFRSRDTGEGVFGMFGRKIDKDGKLVEPRKRGAWFEKPLKGWGYYENGKFTPVERQDVAGWYTCAVLKSTGGFTKDGDRVTIKKDENILFTRGLVLESDKDSASWDKVLNWLLSLGAKIAMITHSGKRGHHAILRLPDVSKDEFKALINGKVKEMFARLGADTGAMTFGRLTRLPNVIRQNTGQEQTLKMITPFEHVTKEEILTLFVKIQKALQEHDLSCLECSGDEQNKQLKQVEA